MSNLWQRTAAPLPEIAHKTAGVVSWTAGVSVTHVSVHRICQFWSIIIRRLGNAQRRLLPEPGHAGKAGTYTGFLSQVTLVALRTAVLLIGTAHGLQY